jgi:heavy metal response regulator
MRVLIVEDEASIADFLRRGLAEAGYAVDVAEDGEEAIIWAEAAPYDLVVLDRMLPRRDGLSVCRELRGRGLRMPILMLTARDTVDDRVAGLDAGADDYLVKPFAFAEVLARMRALLRREPLMHAPVLRVGDLSIDTATQTVQRGNTPIALTSKEYSLLEYMARHANRVLTRDMIAEHVWDYSFDNITNVIDVHIRALRRKIDEPFEQKLIHTVRGAGYRLGSAP